MDFPLSLQSTGGIAVLALILGMFWWMSHRRQRGEFVRSLPELGLAYEWVATPLAKAKKDLVRRFPELDAVVADSPRDSISLIRFGLFNMAEAPIGVDQIVRPVEILFPEDADILSATFGEALKVKPKQNPEPSIAPGKVVLPQFPMTPRSTVIFNVIVRGGATPVDVLGETEGYGSIKRVS